MLRYQKYVVGTRNVHTGAVEWFQDLNGETLRYSNTQAHGALRYFRHLFRAAHNTAVVVGFYKNKGQANVN